VRAVDRINWAQRALQLPEGPDFLLEYVRDVIPNDVANLRMVVEIVLETIARVVASLHSNNVSEYEPEAGEIVDSKVDSIVDSEVGRQLNQFFRNVETGQWVEIGRLDDLSEESIIQLLSYFRGSIRTCRRFVIIGSMTTPTILVFLIMLLRSSTSLVV